MKLNILKTIVAILLPIQAVAFSYLINDFDNTANEDRVKYIERYKKIAIEEMNRAGIPASIKLAQGILESGDGKSQLATKANNHFGIKCGNTWTGDTYYVKDDDYENGVLVKSCFRGYKNADESYRAHSEFLTDPRKAYRYGPLFELDIYDYKAWAHGLKKSGYATNPNYANLLIRIIEANNLYQYDRQQVDDIDDEFVSYIKDQIIKHNQVKMIFAEDNDTPLDIAQRYNISTRRILRYNELQNSDEHFKQGDRVYLQPKRSSWRGKKKLHRVEKGETMYSIGQKYGIKSHKLYRKNRMPVGAEPLEGELISLRGKISKNKAPKYDNQPYRNDFEENLPSLKSVLIDFALRANKDAGTKPTENIVIPDPNGNGVIVEPEVKDEADFIDEDEFEEEEEKEREPVYYVVQKGDTLYRISKRFNVSVQQIRTLNDMKDNIIRVDQKLRVQ